MKKQDYIVNWISEYAAKSGLTSLVIGISGGVDSALTSTLCALTGLETTVVSLPIHQDASQLKRAQDHAAWLRSEFDNVSFIEVDLTSTFEQFKFNFSEMEIALANSRSRLRMTALYQLAQERSALVVGTGNKVEDFGVGFYTKYGDGGVDISPIADLYKSEVVTLAREVGVHSDITEAQPTDGLWSDNRTDEEQIGASYDELEWAMQYPDNPLSSCSGRQLEVLNIYKKLHAQNKHKMVPIPICKFDS